MGDHVRRRDHFGRSAAGSVRVASSVRPSGITLWGEVGVSLVLAGVLLVGLFAAITAMTAMIKGVEETDVGFFALTVALMSVVSLYGGSTGFSSQLMGAKRLLQSNMVSKYSSKPGRTGLAGFRRCGEGGSWSDLGLRALL